VMPEAVADAYETDEDTTLSVPGSGVLGNDADHTGAGLQAELVSGTSRGSLALDPDGSFTYTPDENFHGSDSFSYRALRGDLESDPVTVTIDVSSVNDAPVADAEAYLIGEDFPLVVAAPGVLGNDDDPDGDAVSAVSADGPDHGSLALESDGSFTYVPAPNYNGPDSFSYQASDGDLESGLVTVTIDVFAISDAISALDDTYAVDEDATLSVDAPGVLANDEDPDGGSLSAALVSSPEHGELTLEADGSFTYTPEPDYNGSDTFVYRAEQGEFEFQEATVTIEVAAVDDPSPPPPPAGETPAPPAAPVPPPPPPPLAEPAVADLKLASRCVRRARAGRVRVAMTMRMAVPRPLQIRIARAAGRASKGCPGPKWSRRDTLRYRTVKTVRRVAAPGARGVRLKLRLKPGLYRVTVRAHLDGGRLSPPVHDFMRVVR
jgi:VCBS repeat-containing protein